MTSDTVKWDPSAISVSLALREALINSGAYVSVGPKT